MCLCSKSKFYEPLFQEIRPFSLNGTCSGVIWPVALIKILASESPTSRCRKVKNVLTLWPTVTICKTVCSLQMEFKTWQIKDLCCVYILSVTISWVLVKRTEHERQKNWAVRLKDSTWTCSGAKLYTGCVELYTGVLLLNPCPLYWNQIEFWCTLRFLPLLDVT